jgi:hypothetical protein
MAQIMKYDFSKTESQSLVCDVFEYVASAPVETAEAKICKTGIMLHLRDLLSCLEADEHPTD